LRKTKQNIAFFFDNKYLFCCLFLWFFKLYFQFNPVKNGKNKEEGVIT